MRKRDADTAALSASAVRKDVFSPYEGELRALFPSSDEILREAKQLTQARKKTKKRVAGMAVLLLAIGTVALDPAWQVETMTTGVGQQASYTLPDGSRVVLNTNTILRQEHHVRTRQFQLVQGEAAFTVSHGWRPFTVTAQDVHVRDIGTQFNVDSTPERVRVAVLEGAVEVSIAEQRQILNMGESIESRQGKFARVNHINPDQEGAWQQGKLVFDGTPLRQVVREIQRYSAMNITVDQDAAGMRISGVYDITVLDALIEDLSQSLPVEVTKAADGQVMIRKAHRLPT